MRILVTTDAHIYKTPDGNYWCGAIYGYDFWTRYMNVFETVRIVARIKYVNIKEDTWKKVDGPNVEIFEIPFYQGPKQLLREYKNIKKKSTKIQEECDCALFRLPSPTGQLIWKQVKDIPKGIEVVYDLTDDLNDPNRSLFLKFITYVQSSFLKKACLEANGVSYVTESSIQKHYPAKASIQGKSKSYFESYYSTITLKDSVYTAPRNFTGKSEFMLALSDVAMNSERKGERIFIQVIEKLRRKGFKVGGYIIGDGTKKNEFETYAKELGVSEFITFTGRLASSEDVMELLEKSDIYLFPTVAEGLPRGILEAMAVGLPVVTSPVGGIPEVITNDFLVNPTDVDGYVNVIEQMITNTSLMNDVSHRNFEKAREFNNTILQKRRDEFYNKLADLIE